MKLLAFVRGGMDAAQEDGRCPQWPVWKEVEVRAPHGKQGAEAFSSLMRVS